MHYVYAFDRNQMMMTDWDSLVDGESTARLIDALVDEVLAANPQSVADFKAGKEKAIGFLTGQVMKKSRGKANPPMVQAMLREKMSK